MGLLGDKQLHDAISANNIVSGLPNLEFSQAKDRIQAASIDLSIGKVYIPGSEAKAFESMTLDQGHTVVVVTAETLKLPDNMAGIAYPPARLARDGVLMTNPGHIDPGYEGPLHFTIIHMGHEPKHLRAGDTIATLLLFELTKPCTFSWDKRNAVGSSKATISAPDWVNRLPRDFMNFTSRADQLVNTKVEGSVSQAKGEMRELLAQAAADAQRRLTEADRDTQVSNEKTKAVVAEQFARANSLGILIALALAVFGIFSNSRVAEVAADLAITRAAVRDLHAKVDSYASKNSLAGLDARLGLLESQAGDAARLRQLEESVKKLQDGIRTRIPASAP